MSAITPTQSNTQAALRAFLLDVLPAYGPDGNPVEVIAAVQNRVPEPEGTSFVVMTPTRFERLETNVDSYQDCRFLGSIAAAKATFSASIQAVQGAPALMTVIEARSGVVPIGAVVSGNGVAPNTTILYQISGAPGGVGAYAVTPPNHNVAAAVMTAPYGLLTAAAPAFGQITVGAMLFGVGVAPGTTITADIGGSGGAGTYIVTPGQALSTATLAAGTKTLQQNAKCVVQIDCHSADSSASDMAQTIATALRDEYGVDFFANLDPPLNGVVPLFADDPKYIPFINAEAQFEWRWTLDCHLQVNQTVSVPQQFFDAAAVELVDVDAVYPPSATGLSTDLTDPSNLVVEPLILTGI